MMQLDYFLHSHVKNFTDIARNLMGELYCTLNCKVSIPVLASKLEITSEEAEKWIVSMVRNVSNNSNNNSGSVLECSVQDVQHACIDSTAQLVIIPPVQSNTSQQIIDKTRDHTARSSMLSSNMTNMMQEQAILLEYR